MSLKIYAIFYVVLVALVSVFVGTVSAQEYRIGEGDVLKITVYENDDLTTVTRVNANGTIRLPLLGEVGVEGLTLNEMSIKIKELYADGYIVNPQVHVFIQEFQSNKATILGQVKTPGLYELKEETSLLELISKSGGLTHDAGEQILIKRKSEAGGSSDAVIRVNIYELVEMGNVSQNVNIRDEDTVYVSKKELQYVYITGEVKKPDAYEYEKGFTVIRAITQAGGFSDKAAPSKVKIIVSFRQACIGQKNIWRSQPKAGCPCFLAGTLSIRIEM